VRLRAHGPGMLGPKLNRNALRVRSANRLGWTADAEGRRRVDHVTEDEAILDFGVPSENLYLHRLSPKVGSAERSGHLLKVYHLI
jgi:hypothetical protein